MLNGKQSVKQSF